MSTTTSVTVANHILSEAKEFAALKPLRARTGVAVQLVNAINIDGEPTLVRKIPARTAIADAADDVEGAEFTGFAQLAYGSTTTLTPVGKVSGIASTVKALRRRFGGATYEEVKNAVKNGSVKAIGMLADMLAEIEASHMTALEKAVLAEFVNATLSVGTSGANVTFANMLDSQTKVLNENPEHFGLVSVLSQAQLGHLKQELVSASGGLAALWSSGVGNEFLAAVGGADAMPAVSASGALAGMPIYVAAGDNMSTSGSNVIGATFVLGRGATGEVGSLRGFAEICEGHAPSYSLFIDEASDVAKMIGRYEWDTALHTADHICKIVTKAAV